MSCKEQTIEEQEDFVKWFEEYKQTSKYKKHVLKMQKITERKQQQLRALEQLEFQEQKSKAGHVYIMGSQYEPDKYKVGHTKDIEQRLKDAQLFAPFIKVISYIASKQCHKSEIYAHKLLVEYELGREWFKAEYTIVLKAVCDAVCVIDKQS